MAFDPDKMLEQALIAHGVNSTRVNEGLSLHDSDAILSAAIVRTQSHPNGTVVQLDVRAHSERLGDKWLIDSFAGTGPDDSKAAEQAFRKFLGSTFHVLLAVLVDPKYGGDWVEWDTWHSDQHNWKICLGQVLYQGSVPDTFEFENVLRALKLQFLQQLNGEPHWIRTYFLKTGSEPTASEILIDNQNPSEGRDLFVALDLPEGTLSARHFLMMTPL